MRGSRAVAGLKNINDSLGHAMGDRPLRAVAERLLIRAIIALAKSLGLKLIAEGVEAADQHAFLSLNGCDEGQGCLFSRPVAAADLPAVLARCTASAAA